MNLEKLPKAVRHHVSKLEADCLYWKTKALEAASEDGQRARITVLTYDEDPGEGRGLPNDSHIRFRLSGYSPEAKVTINLSEDFRRLEISGDNAHLILEPRSSNAISLRAARRLE